MNLKHLRKKIEKLYCKNNQRLYVNSFVELNDECVEIYAFDGDNFDSAIYLFDIQTIKGFYDYELVMTDIHGNYIGHVTKYVNDIAHTPFYFDRMFTLKTTDKITTEEIEKCTKYFCENVLNGWNIWNIRFQETIDARIQKADEVLNKAIERFDNEKKN